MQLAHTVYAAWMCELILCGHNDKKQQQQQKI